MPCNCKYCVNCFLYGWSQPEQKKNRPCAQCERVNYCGKDCQTEHWEKVHKNHCIELAGKISQPNGSHAEKSCPKCIEEKAIVVAGRSKQLARPDNGVYGCPIRFTEYADLPFPLGDLTGVFETRAEKIISTLQRLHLKMFYHKNPLLDETSHNKILPYHDQLRSLVWDCYLEASGTVAAEDMILEGIHRMEWPKWSDFYIDLDKRNSDYYSKDKLQVWDIYLIVQSFVMENLVSYRNLLNVAEVLPAEIQNLLPSEGEVNELETIMDDVLNLVWPKVPPFKELVKLICGGNSKQECLNCKDRITIMEVFNSICSHKTLLKKGRSFVAFSGTVRVYCCGKSDCSILVLKEYSKRVGSMKVVMKIVEAKFSKFRCDFCFHVGKKGKGHRCSECLSKLYCSHECRDKDLSVHRQFCKKDLVQRKRKEEKVQRKEDGNELAKEMKDLMKDVFDTGNFSNSLVNSVTEKMALL